MPSPADPPTGLQITLDVLTALGTVVAAGLAAWSAWIARGSARAAVATVEEARLARKAQIAPRLVLERDFLDFHLQWPHPNTLNGEPVYLARRDWKDKSPVAPTFSLTNHGESPALEIQLVFDLSDSNGELEVPEMFQSLGLSLFSEPTIAGSPNVKVIQFSRSDGGGSGLPMYRRWTTDIANCAPGQTRTVDFPQGLLTRHFLRGLQYWVRRGEVNAIRPMILTVEVIAYDVDGECHRTQFRFEAFPFWQGQSDPLVVNGHFRELPKFDIGNHARVA